MSVKLWMRERRLRLVPGVTGDAAEISVAGGLEVIGHQQHAAGLGAVGVGHRVPPESGKGTVFLRTWMALGAPPSHRFHAGVPGGTVALK